MKFLDVVRVIVDKDEYIKQGIKKGMAGTIIFPEIRYGCFGVNFECVFDPETLTCVHNGWLGEGYNGTEDYDTDIAIEDLELVEEFLSDEEVLETIRQSPCLKNGNWMYKVEDGFAICVDGTKLNKTAYDYSDIKKLRC
jgi:hypothetical protein